MFNKEEKKTNQSSHFLPKKVIKPPKNDLKFLNPINKRVYIIPSIT